MYAFRTLIVEDNISFRVSLARMLLARFPTMSIVTAAGTGPALEMARRLAPDLVFMDVRLPDGNGLEATRAIKVQCVETVVVVVTAYDLPEYREAAYRCGASYFFAKGVVSQEDIIGVVERTMNDVGAA